jgi:hypothetical protein
MGDKGLLWRLRPEIQSSRKHEIPRASVYPDWVLWQLTYLCEKYFKTVWYTFDSILSSLCSMNATPMLRISLVEWSEIGETKSCSGHAHRDKMIEQEKDSSVRNGFAPGS